MGEWGALIEPLVLKGFGDEMEFLSKGLVDPMRAIAGVYLL